MKVSEDSDRILAIGIEAEFCGDCVAKFSGCKNHRQYDAGDLSTRFVTFPISHKKLSLI
jgi:hypothetical protein